jgi:hypothetical protein
MHGDHLVVACTGSGISAIARKIFPTAEDTRRGRPRFVAAASDYSGRERFLTLRSGHRALLCACYDAFGLPTQPGDNSARVVAIRQLFWRDRVLGEDDRRFVALRDRCLARWRAQLAAQSPSVVLTAIHGFDRPGRDSYWQRHGLAVASAATNGGLAIGSAHFRQTLPLDLERSPLAAVRVPEEHLVEGVVRRSWRHFPIAFCPVYHRSNERPDGVLRLYSV